MNRSNVVVSASFAWLPPGRSVRTS